jgi:hypothetical protein
VKAASSKNGDFLVISDQQLTPMETSYRNKVVKRTLQVFPKDPFNNPGGKLSLPRMLVWRDGPIPWTVVLESGKGQPSLECPVPLISDNGWYLVLLIEQQGLEPQHSVMQIYQPASTPPNGARRGELIKKLTLKELWPGYKSWDTVFTSGMPQWFKGATFAFSADSRTLIHKTAWGDTIRIDSATGAVSKDAH